MRRTRKFVLNIESDVASPWSVCFESEFRKKLCLYYFPFDKALQRIIGSLLCEFVKANFSPLQKILCSFLRSLFPNILFLCEFFFRNEFYHLSPIRQFSPAAITILFDGNFSFPCRFSRMLSHGASFRKMIFSSIQIYILITPVQ